MSDPDKQKLRKYSKETLVEYVAAIGLVSYRHLDVIEKAERAKRLVAEHDNLVKKINNALEKRRLSLKEMGTTMRDDKRLQTVRAKLDKMMAEEKASA